MKTYQGSEIRNVAVVGHAHSGKTTLIAALLHEERADCFPGGPEFFPVYFIFDLFRLYWMFGPEGYQHLVHFPRRVSHKF